MSEEQRAGDRPRVSLAIVGTVTRKEMPALFHVAMTHTSDRCPLFNPDGRSASRQLADVVSSQAKELGAPAHVAYHPLEANSRGPVATLIGRVGLVPRGFAITPLMTLHGAQTLLAE